MKKKDNGVFNDFYDARDKEYDDQSSTEENMVIFDVLQVNGKETVDQLNGEENLIRQSWSS